MGDCSLQVGYTAHGIVWIWSHNIDAAVLYLVMITSSEKTSPDARKYVILLVIVPSDAVMYSGEELLHIYMLRVLIL